MSAESFLWDVDVNVYWAGLQYLPDTWSFRDKKNPHIRLWVVQKGEVAANIQGKPYTVKEGEAVLFPAAESVHFRSIASGELHLLSVLFTLQSRTGYRYRSLPGVPTMLSNLDMSFMETHMMAVVEEIEQRRIGYKMGANSILQFLLVHILRAGNYKEPQQADAWIDVGSNDPFGDGAGCRQRDEADAARGFVYRLHRRRDRGRAGRLQMANGQLDLLPRGRYGTSGSVQAAGMGPFV